MSFFSRKRSLWSLLAAAGLLAATFWRPTLTLQRDAFRYLFVFDITQSMNVADVRGYSRLDFAKRAVRDGVTALPCGSRAGLALFAGHRVFALFTPVEVCAHYRELQTMIARIDWRMAWEARSEVAKGLLKSVELIGELDEDARLVFLSDGHEAPPLHPEYRQRFRGEPGAVKGVIAGVGALEPSPIPKYDFGNKLLGYWQAHEVMQIDTYSMGRFNTDVRNEAMSGVESGDIEARIRAGAEHLSALKERHLQTLAGETGLHYLRLASDADLAVRLRQADLAYRTSAATDMRWLLAALALALLIVGYLPGWQR